MPEATPAEGRSRTLLRELLQARHWLPHRRFCAEYDKVAAKLDRRLVGTYPSPSTYKRWLRGKIEVPRSEPCAVLEAMFPEHRVEDLFKPHRNESNPTTAPLRLEPAGFTTHPPADRYRVITSVGDMVIVAIDRRTFLGGSGAAILAAGGVTPITSAGQIVPDVVEHLTEQLESYYRADLLLGPDMVIPSVPLRLQASESSLRPRNPSRKQSILPGKPVRCDCGKNCAMRGTVSLRGTNHLPGEMSGNS